MKTLKNNNQSIYLTVVQRTLSFPFFAGVMFVAMTITYVRWVINYIRFGSEAIAYTNKITRKSILDVYNKVSQQCSSCNVSEVITDNHCNVCGAKQGR